MTYSVSSISNRDLQLLYHYRILRQPSDYLKAILRDSQPTNIELTEPTQTVLNEVECFVYKILTKTVSGKIPVLEFYGKENDWKQIEDLTEVEVTDGVISIYTSRIVESPTPITCRLYWTDSIQSLTDLLSKHSEEIKELREAIDKINHNISNLKFEGAPTLILEGLDDNLVKFGLGEDNKMMLADSMYRITNATEAQTLLNPTQELLSSMVKALDGGVRIVITDGLTRTLEGFHGHTIVLVGNGSWILKDIDSKVYIKERLSGTLLCQNCIYIQLNGKVTMDKLGLFNTHCCCQCLDRGTLIKELALFWNSTFQHFWGKIEKLAIVGAGCTYYSGNNYRDDAEDNLPAFEPKDILGIAHLFTGYTIVCGHDISFVTGQTDIPVPPILVETEHKGTISVDPGPGPTPEPGDITDPGTAEGRKKEIYLWLRRQGFSVNHACGILGNLTHENSQFHPNLVQGGGYSDLLSMAPYGEEEAGYGLIQWTGASSYAWLYNWCRAHALNYDSLDGQVKCLAAVPMNWDIASATNQDSVAVFGEDGSGTASYNLYVYKNGNSTYGWAGVGEVSDVFGALNELTIDEATVSFLASMERPDPSVMGDRKATAGNVYTQASDENWESEV